MTQLKIGDKAPLFTGTDQDGKSISLSDFRGRKVILYFSPKTTPPDVPPRPAVCVTAGPSCSEWALR